MATIQIRDVPEEAYETIRRRARAEGKSIQSYMRDEVVAVAKRRTKGEALDAVENALARDPSAAVTAEDVVADLAAERR